MVNSWSFLSDELNMTKHSKYYYEYDRNDPNRENPFTSDQSYWEDDGFSLTGNPMASQDTICMASGSDTINFGAAQPVPMDYLSLGGEDSISFNLDMTTASNNPNRFKYLSLIHISEPTRPY